jgi:hypothetical protein
LESELWSGTVSESESYSGTISLPARRVVGAFEWALLSYGPPWAHYLGGYQDRLLGGPLGLPDLRCTAPDGVKQKDYRGEVLD